MRPLIALLFFLCAPLSPAEFGPLVSRPTLYALRLTGTRGLASYYHRALEGCQMANGDRYRAARMTAASPTLPLGRTVTVCRADRPLVCCDVLVADRGPFVAGRILDLSRAAARKLGMIHAGVCAVTVMETP